MDFNQLINVQLLLIVFMFGNGYELKIWKYLRKPLFMYLFESVLILNHPRSPFTDVRIWLPVNAEEDDVEDLRTDLEISDCWEVIAKEIGASFLKLVLHECQNSH